MGRRGLLGIALTTSLLLAAGSGHRLEQTWIDIDRGAVTFGKLIIVGISADRETRHQFENKFVSHLRGRGHDAVASYTLVENLAVIEDRAALIETIERERIDGVISVRAVRLEELTEDEWADRWDAMLEAGTTLRAMIDEALPWTGKKAKRYGVEVALWRAPEGRCVWAGRTDTYTRKGLRRGASEFVQIVMGVLEDAELL